MIGKKLSHFRIEAKLGSGGMGEVFRSHEQNLGRYVVPKVLPHTFANDDQRVGAFTPQHAHLQIAKLITRRFST